MSDHPTLDECCETEDYLNDDGGAEGEGKGGKVKVKFRDLLACPHCGRQPVDMGAFAGDGGAYIASIECECGAGMMAYQWWPNGPECGPVPPWRVEALCRKRWNRRRVQQSLDTPPKPDRI